MVIGLLEKGLSVTARDGCNVSARVSLQCLRRSGPLTEWVECPAGVVAQIMGHKPSATAEKHYKVRPLALLHMWHARIEAWALEQAGIKFKPGKSGLRAVKWYLIPDTQRYTLSA